VSKIIPLAVKSANLPLEVSCLVCEWSAYFPISHKSYIDSYNEHIMAPVHHQNQDTNDRFLANIQRNGTFSVIPRIAAGEVTPDGLIAIGRVAKKYGLYTKVVNFLCL
jgi:NAD(P)H-nitrite reductase large subunit